MRTKGATFEPVGQWRRAYTYPGAGEDKHAAINREILSVRNKVGLLDASTLGKIEIKGPDAAEFLDRMYTNMFSTLKVGRCRYGLMMNELGFLTDDGVTVRLAEDHFLMHTTSGGADRIAAWLEEWLQTEWTHYKVFVTPVTEQWAQFAIAGPRARDVLAKLEPDFDISHEAFPHMSFKRRQARRLSGARLPHQLLGRAVLRSGNARQSWAAACGMRSSRRARNSASSPMAPKRCMCCAPRKATSSSAMKPTAPRRRSMWGLRASSPRRRPTSSASVRWSRAYLKGPNRKQLVGLLTEDPNEVLPDGAYAVKRVKDKPPMEMIGQVTSSYHVADAWPLDRHGADREWPRPHGRNAFLPARRRQGDARQDRRSGLL